VPHGPLAAALALGNVVLYACVYTPLKRVSVFNTHVGAVVGAVPPLVGWAAATGSLAAVEPFLLAYTLFAWQFPHFYALAWTLRKDYARGGHVMVPVVDTTGGAWTARLAQRHAMLLALVPPVAAVLGVVSPMFAVEGLALNGYFLWLAHRFARDPGDATARPLFLASLWYLPVFLFLVVFHATSWRQEDARPAALRGSSYGEAVEHALATARAVGRSVCAHVLFVDALMGEGAAERLRQFVEGEGGGGVGGGSSGGAGGKAGAAKEMAQAAAAAVVAVAGEGAGRSACPVTAATQVTESAKRLLTGGSARPATDASAAATPLKS
jgi:hypothetical protein